MSRVNHEVPEAAFVPQPQPGTQMIDETVPGGITVRVHQPEAALARQAADLAKEVRPIAAPTTPPVVAAPAGSWWSTMFLWGGAIALLCAAVVYIVRMRRTS